MVVITYSVHRNFVDFLSTYISIPFGSIAVERSGLIIQSSKVMGVRQSFSTRVRFFHAWRYAVPYSHIYIDAVVAEFGRIK